MTFMYGSLSSVLISIINVVSMVLSEMSLLYCTNIWQPTLVAEDQKNQKHVIAKIKILKNATGCLNGMSDTRTYKQTCHDHRFTAKNVDFAVTLFWSSE